MYSSQDFGVECSKWRNVKDYVEAPQVPKDWECCITTIGSPKPKMRMRSPQAFPNEVDSEIKLCYKCKSCRLRGPLIQCDYCPLLFHAYCLEVPSHSPDTSKWMCPNHVEPMLERLRNFSFAQLSQFPVVKRVKRDGIRGSCAIPSKLTAKDFSNEEFVPGSLVWARLYSYPWWPAMVEDDPDDEEFYRESDDKDDEEYHVVFITDKPEKTRRAWLARKNLKPYVEAPTLKYVKKKYIKSLELSLMKAETALSMTLSERLRNFSFAQLSQFPVVKRVRRDISRKRKLVREESYKRSYDYMPKEKLRKLEEAKAEYSCSKKLEHTQSISKVTIETIQEDLKFVGLDNILFSHKHGKSVFRCFLCDTCTIYQNPQQLKDHVLGVNHQRAYAEEKNKSLIKIKRLSSRNEGKKSLEELVVQRLFSPNTAERIVAKGLQSVNEIRAPKEVHYYCELCDAPCSAHSIYASLNWV